MACGSALTQAPIEGRDRAICRACRRVHWENPVPAAAVAVLDGSRILLCRRAIQPYRGQWGLPAGYQEVDETCENAAVREVREETGLIVRLTGLLDVLTTPDDPRKASILVVYSGEAVDGELEPGSDVDEAAWYSLNELPSELAFHNNRVLLERLRKGEVRRW